ncbi:MAG: FAD binding domain-containing protein [Spirochaetota bacterium]
MTHEFSYHAPQSLDEALGLLAEFGSDAEVLSGGTDLLVGIRGGLSRPVHVVDIKRIEELKTLSSGNNEGLFIGATVTVNQMLDYAPVAESFSILKHAGEVLATHQLRNRATPVGNIVTASPCGDMSSPLLCLDCEVDIVSKDGGRRVPLGDFITGVKQTALQPHEIVRGLRIPTTWAGANSGYKKLKRIKGHDLGVVSVAMLRNGNAMRVAISSAAPTPILLPDFDSEASVEEVQEVAAGAISPIDDVRCTKEYRSFMVGVFIERLMNEVAA